MAHFLSYNNTLSTVSFSIRNLSENVVVTLKHFDIKYMYILDEKITAKHVSSIFYIQKSLTQIWILLRSRIPNFEVNKIK